MKKEGYKTSGEAARRLAMRRYINTPRGAVPTEYEPYVNLAISVVKEMLKEYRHADGVLKKYPHNRAAKKEMEEAKEFFESDWCTFLTGGIEGSVLLELCEKECRV